MLRNCIFPIPSLLLPKTNYAIIIIHCNPLRLQIQSQTENKLTFSMCARYITSIRAIYKCCKCKFEQMNRVPCWKRYLLWFAQEHVDFRFQEIDSLISMLHIRMQVIDDRTISRPFWIVSFASEHDAKLLASRSISLRSCIELWAHSKTINGLHKSLQQAPLDASHFSAEKSFKIEVETFCKHFSQRQKIDKLEEFDYLPCKGPVCLTNPDVTFNYIEFYGTDPVSPPEQPYDVFFGRWTANGSRCLLKKLSLKTRKFIGNTSMDAQLSLLMANQAQVQRGDLVLDPFVGSGSLLVAAAQCGGYVMGTDMDFLMLHARTRPSRITNSRAREKDESIRANMKQYNLENQYIDVLVNDFAMVFWKEGLTFDAIITDPPYGIRESTERIGTHKENYTIEERHLHSHIPEKIEYGISKLYFDLLAFAAVHLKLNGRLVCWFPVFRDEYSPNGLPQHPCLSIEANSEQILNKHTSRRLLTYKKIKQPSHVDDSVMCEMNANGIQDFREKYYEIREETRRERRMKQGRGTQNSKK